ncbi:MAG: hypothetical protein JW768_10490 [Chitinispirillaceae bacterium]|nr:hypothetical protein [Chitinispirillaceae bacterium]
MRSPTTALIPAILVLPGMIVMQCSLGDLAGGSGAGNPGGSVSVAVRAEVNLSTLKTAAEGAAQAPECSAYDTSIVVQDREGLDLTIERIVLSGVSIKFMLDPSEDPREVLSDLRNRPWYLAPDSHCIALLGGPFKFNGLTGDVYPDLGTINLPLANYTGMLLRVSKECYSWSDYSHYVCAPIYLSGTLPYNGKSRRFIVELNRAFSKTYQFAGGGTFSLSSSDTTHMELRFNAKKWFSSVDLKNALDRGILSVNQSGEILIGDWASSNLAEGIETAIYSDFIASGKLVLY